MPTFLHWNWNGQLPLGNDKSLGIALARNRDERGNHGALELFYIGTNGDLRHLRQGVAGDSLSWVEQPPFVGSNANQTASALQIAVGQNADGRLEMIYVGTNNRIYRNRQVAAGSLEWEGQTTPFGDHQAIQIAISLDALDRLEIVYVGTNGHIYHDRQVMPGAADWVGQTPFSGLSAWQVAMARNSNNHNLLEIFYVGTNSGLYHIRQLDTGGMKDWTEGNDRFDHNSATQVVVGTNADGRLEIFYVGTNSDLFHNWQTSTNDTTLWFGENRFPGNSAKEIAVAADMDGRLEIFYVGTDNGIFHNWQAEPNGNWLGEVRYPDVGAIHVAAALNNDGRMELCYVGGNTHLFHDFHVLADGGFVNQNGLGANAVAPALGSNSNYLLSNCGFLVDVAITIIVTEDIYVEKAGFPGNAEYPPLLQPSNYGFSWQLNCYSPMGEVASWQQYGISLNWAGNLIYGWVDNWKGDADDSDEIINMDFGLSFVPQNKIPAGYQLGIALQNDLSGNITGVTCWVVDEKGGLAGHGTLILTQHGLKAADLAPITAFELNLVGESDLQESVFATGAGEIIYAASTLMTPEMALPPCVELRFPTGETSNSVYEAMSALPSNVLTQTFSVTTLDSLVRINAPKFRIHRRPRR